MKLRFFTSNLQSLDLEHPRYGIFDGVKWRVDSRTGAVRVVSRWIYDEAFAASPQSGLA